MFIPPPDKPPKPVGKGKIDFQLLYQLGCKACPLKQIENDNPDMAATGAERPLIYILGEAPGADEDEEGRQFVGKSGELLRERIKAEFPRFRKRIRWNNTVRTRPWSPGQDQYGLPRKVNRTPSPIEIACCRPSVQNDIERSKPKAIFGFGNVPLHWATGWNGINAWRGRRLPVRVGSHVCWYYPFLHPAGLLRQGKRARGRDGRPPPPIDPVPRDSRLPSEQERMWVFDLRRAFNEIEELPEAKLWEPSDALSNTTLITNCTDAALTVIQQELDYMAAQPVVGIDYETFPTRPYHEEAAILTVGVSTPTRGLAFGLDHPGATWTKKQRSRLIEMWKRFLIKARGTKAVHNLLFELEWTGYMFGEQFVRAGKWECTQTQAGTLDERPHGTKPGPQTLETLAFIHFGLNIKKLTPVDKSDLRKVPFPNVLEYNALDARAHCRLEGVFRPLIRQENLGKAHGYMLRRIPALALSQLKGIPISQKYVRALDRKYIERLADTYEEIDRHPHAKLFKKVTGHDFNPLAADDAIELYSAELSTKKYGKPMLDRKEIKVDIKLKESNRKAEAKEDYNQDGDEKSTKDSANKAVLRAIPGKFPKLILRAREANKRHSSYVMKMLPGHDKTTVWPDGMLHPTFNTWKAVTGRMSADGPSVQNWPKRDGEAREVRKPIVPDKNCMILAIDYGQIEARVIAMYTKDKKFCKALWDNYDIHGEWARRLALAWPERIGGKQNINDKLTMKNFRTDVKNQWTFPLVFGATVPSVAEYLRMPENIVKEQFEQFWREFEGIRTWQQDLMAFYKEHGYVETFTGRRRRGPLSPNKVYNSPVQGVTAEIVMDAFCRLSEMGDPVLQAELNIHDDLTFLRVPERKVDHYLEKIIDVMIQPPFDFINVPISLEASVGENWLDMEEVGTYASHEWNIDYHRGRKTTGFKLAA